MNNKRGAIWALLLFLNLSPAWSDTEESASVSTEHATVTLFADTPRAASGGPVWLGVHFELIPHWHIYWRNPGASGSPPSVRWSLPQGWEAGEIHWPVPQRIPVGPLTNYGYEGEVILLVPIWIPADANPDGPWEIVADAEWLVCREECIPEAGRLSLRLDRLARETTRSALLRERLDRARARWPEPDGLSGRYSLQDGELAISVDLPNAANRDASDVWFAANEWGPVDASASQDWRRTPAGFDLRVPTGDVPPEASGLLEGLLVLEFQGDGATVRRGYQMRLESGAVAPQSPALGLGLALSFALLGGLILNLMPCVLPVLGIKVLSFLREAGSDRQRLAGHGLVYAAGVVGSFALLATTLLLLRAGGESLGWGFQLQSPVLVALLAYLMLLVGLNLSGVFSVGGGLMGLGQSATRGQGYPTTFATGVLAAVVASPCTAPFMGVALGYAITQPPGEALGVFLALAVGFALPVLLLSLFPAWVRLIPRPGPWMGRLAQALAFPMYATGAWLLWVLSQQVGSSAFGAVLAGLVIVALGAWLYGQWNPRGWRLGLLGAGVSAAVALSLAPVTAIGPTANPAISTDAQPWGEQEVQRLLATGRPVFVNFTAAWCITCKVNERVALSTERTRRLFESRSVAYLVADWTRRDPTITRQLERYGRSGVPLYLLYSPAAERPLVLPQLLTQGLVADAVRAL